MQRYFAPISIKTDSFESLPVRTVQLVAAEDDFGGVDSQPVALDGFESAVDDGDRIFGLQLETIGGQDVELNAFHSVRISRYDR